MHATIRRVVALVVLLCFVASFIPWGGAEPWAALWWVERLQFVPALLGTWSGKVWAAVILGALVFFTLLFGRVFCSWLCPLGILQDLANRVARPCPGKRKGSGVRFARNHPWLRGIMALLAFGGLAAGSVGLLAWLDPYSIAARAMASMGNPPILYLLQGEEAAQAAWMRYGIPGAVVAAFFLALPLGLAVWRGRLYCNTICPVGAVLGALSRFAPLAPRIDKSACGRCGACMKACKAQAIDLKTGRVDSSRCVSCYNCLSACSRGAMRLRQKGGEQPVSAPAPERVDSSRRAFLGLGIASVAGAALPELPQPAPSSNPAEVGTNEGTFVVPPGAQSAERFFSHCTGCGLCVVHCPTGVLRPGLLSFTPWLHYSHASCAPDCVACSQACPTGALLPLSLAEKRRTQIGLARYEQKNCRVWTQGQPCGKCVTEVQCPTGALVAQEVNVPTVHADACRGCRRCSSVCPVGAISRVEVEGRERKLAVIDRSKCIGCGACASACRPQAISLAALTAPKLAHPEKCIGCGACEHVCPARRPAALCVVPRAQHLKTAGE